MADVLSGWCCHRSTFITHYRKFLGSMHMPECTRLENQDTQFLLRYCIFLANKSHPFQHFVISKGTFCRQFNIKKWWNSPACTYISKNGSLMIASVPRFGRYCSIFQRSNFLWWFLHSMDTFPWATLISQDLSNAWFMENEQEWWVGVQGVSRTGTRSQVFMFF